MIHITLPFSDTTPALSIVARSAANSMTRLPETMPVGRVLWTRQVR